MNASFLVSCMGIMNDYRDIIAANLGKTVETVGSEVMDSSGKIRENFILSNGERAIVVTDRISAFDTVFGTIPFKGIVLNQIAAWWFKKLDGMVNHHFISTPLPQVSLVKNMKMLPVEIIVRGYLTGSTQTSSWYAYQHTDKKICGITMPDNMKKNQIFDTPIITPTTKPTDGGHDYPISREEILEQGLATPKIWKQVEEYALKMFLYGQKIAGDNGLILVDTKYEMGIDSDGNLCVGDEIHTPDSSRYWKKDTYNERFSKEEEPEMFDKEFFRESLIKKGFDPSQNPKDVDPDIWMDDNIRIETSQKYIMMYEMMTNQKFPFPQMTNFDLDIHTFLSDTKCK